MYIKTLISTTEYNDCSDSNRKYYSKHLQSILNEKDPLKNMHQFNKISKDFFRNRFLWRASKNSLQENSLW